MKKNKATSVIAVILAVLMLLSLFISVIPISAHAVTQDDLDRIQAEKDSLSGKVTECRLRIEQLKEQKAGVLEQKAALDVQNQAANEQMILIAEEIEAYDQLIEEKEEELEAAVHREETQLERYRARVRAMEEHGEFNILALIVNSHSFSEFLTALDDMGEIMESDKALEKKYVEAREETEVIKAEYEAEKEEYELKQADLREEQQELEEQIEEAYATLESLSAEIEKAIEEQKAAEAAEAAAAASVLSIIQALNEQRRQQEAMQQQQQQQQQNPAPNPDNGTGGGSPDTGTQDQGGNEQAGGGGGGLNPGGASGTGSFMWPVPCSTRVTSRFGNRVDPITGEVGRFHSGIDIDGFGNAGNIIVAADSGTVIRAESNGGYGNYVLIDHGNYTQTLYAHMSGIAVSAGSWVEKGQTVGYLGDTGRATGVHCHFEIIINGGYVDPASYFSGLSFWNC